MLKRLNDITSSWTGAHNFLKRVRDRIEGLYAWGPPPAGQWERPVTKEGTL